MRSYLSYLLVLFGLGATALAQSTGTVNGRIVDQAGLALPGVTVTVTNTATQAVRTTVSNAEGLYSLPALQPGPYNVTADLAGFGPQRRAVTLVTGTTVTMDFTMGVAALEESITVTGAAPLVETTRSEVSSTLQLAEVQNLPMLNRNFTGLVQLVPGARPAPVVDTSKTTMGNGMSFSGAGGRNVNVVVDGADNRDDIIGGPVQNFTIEGIQEFKVITHRFTAEHGGAVGAIVQVATKSGTNEVHGSGFLFGRNDAMTAIDHFTKLQGFPKTPYDREQFGGSLGLPIVKDRWFIFGAVERVRENFVQSETPKAVAEAQVLDRAFPSLGIIPVAGVPQPFRDTMYTIKTDTQVNRSHSLSVRWAHQLSNKVNAQLQPTQPDLGTPNIIDNRVWNVVGGHTWIVSNYGLNQLTIDGGRYNLGLFVTVPNPAVTRSLLFPSVTVGRWTGTDAFYVQDKVRLSDAYSHQIGQHSLKTGGSYSFYPKIDITLAIGSCGRMSFFDDPSVIVNNTNGRYPQGFLTPGIVSNVTVGSCSAGGATPPGQAVYGNSDFKQQQFSAYMQDDWRVTPRLTLNLGVRYDRNANFTNREEAANSRVYQALQAIGSPYAELPPANTNNLSPRMGFAYDIGGQGKSVLRGGYGIYYNQLQQASIFSSVLLMKPTLKSLSSAYVNTSPGVGQLPTYVYGVSPLPPGPGTAETELPRGRATGGAWIDPDIQDPYNHQFHVGFTRQLSGATALSADYTHVRGLHELASRQINPIEGPWNPNQGSVPTGMRRLAPAFQAVLGDPDILGGISLATSSNKSKYDELIVHLEHRTAAATVQASYTLASARAFGGIVSPGAGSGTTPGSGTVSAVNSDRPFDPVEWGPSWLDERHRVMLSGIFTLPGDIQVAPVFQVASARPYTLLAGIDLNRDGTNNDRSVDPATGQDVGVNSARGEASWNLDVRASRFFALGGESRRLAVFAEVYNVTNKANFGNIYNGNSRSSTFKQPNGYLAGLPTSRQLQLGARFSF